MRNSSAPREEDAVQLSGVAHTSQARSVLLHPVLVGGFVLTAAALVTLPAQDLPILFVDDLAMIGLGLVVLAAAATIAAAGRARIGSPLASVVVPIVSLAAGTSALSVAGYKTFADGRGWPTWRLALGPFVVAAASLAGYGLGRLLRRVPRLVATLASLLVALMLVAPAGVATTEVAKRGFAPASEDDCVSVAEVRYCPVSGYESLIEDWAFVVDGVLEQVPGEVAVEARRLPVVQRAEGGTTEGVLATPLLGWGRPGGVGEGNAQAALGLGVARAAVGTDGHIGGCGAAPTAREVVIWWLAGQVSPGAAKQVAETGEFADNVSGTNYAADAAPSVETSRYAAQLLRRPSAEVGRRLREEWKRFTDPATSASELGEAFQLDPVVMPEPICD